MQKGHSNNTRSARSSGAEDMAAVDSDESDFGDDMALVPSMKAHTGSQGLGAASAPAAAVPLKKCSAPPTCGRCFARGAHAYCAAVRPQHCCRDGQICAGNYSAAHPRTHGRGLWRQKMRERCAMQTLSTASISGVPSQRLMAAYIAGSTICMGACYSALCTSLPQI